MIIVKLQGGLGNQMFQYALGRNLSLIHKVPFEMDLSYLKKPNQSGRAYQLNGFNLKTTEASEKEIRKYTGPIPKLLDRFFRNRLYKKHIKETFDGFNAYVLKRGDGYFDGHWNMQSERYFHPNEEAIRKDFQLKTSLNNKALEVSKRINNTENSTSVHIRRGDYVTIGKVADVHGILPISYYKNACEMIVGKFPNATFFIFSDDIKWAEENFPRNYPAVFVSSSNISDHEELKLMSSCKHNIIANSTFSWWGAWLNENKDRVAISPAKWFKSGNYNTGNIVPKGWFKI